MRKTLVVHNRHAWRSLRTRAALASEQGVQLFTVEQLAARLAGGFLQPINHDDFNAWAAEALSIITGELDAIKALPGFRRAVSASLSKAWAAGLDLEEEVEATTDPASKARLTSLALLEREILIRLPKNQCRPRVLVAAALERTAYAPAILGRVEIHGHTEIAPVWRDLLSALAERTEVVWMAEARYIPEWLSTSRVKIETRAAESPALIAVSCASPRHEILEALRWARRHLAAGASPHQIAIVSAAPDSWDDHMLALSEAANLPIHFVHGRAALTTSEGQLAAALAEILLRGFSRMRVIRFMALLRTQNPRFSSLPGDWSRAVPEDVPLLDTARWQRTIAGFTFESFSDGLDHRTLLLEAIEAISKGLKAAATIGESLFVARTLAIWRKALIEGPPAALDVTLADLRCDDGLEPEAAILWAPASAIAAVPRPLTWLVGLTSRSWPRRAGEDPLLPEHVIAASRLDPLPAHQADRRDFRTICDMTSAELVFSRARRDSGGRLNGISSLYPRQIGELYLAQSREPEFAASASDRLLARPEEFRGTPIARSAFGAWIDWHREGLTAHDGLVRANHPLLLRSLDRRQSSASLVKLLRDPIGYLWTYGFGWSEPEETDEPLTLDPLAFGNLLHEILEESVTELERSVSGGLANASTEAVTGAMEGASRRVAARWLETKPIPPPVIWERKRIEAAELAIVALSHREEPLPAQHSWAEIPFGGDRHAQVLTEGARALLPWDPMVPVRIPETTIQIGGAIDRLDLAGDRLHARVTDYKSGRLRSRAPQLKGGAELQRCLYAYAVKALLAERPQVEAQLLYPRNNGAGLPLDNPEGTLARLTGYLTAASALFAAGNTIPGPAADQDWYDLAFGLPGGARETYLSAIRPLVAQRLAAIVPLWDEP